MQRLPALIFASLYTALLVCANPSSAQVLSPEQRSGLEAMREGEMRKLVIHEEPQAVSTESFTDLDDATHRLSDSNGHVRLVNFWATWCAPCKREKPSLDALQAEISGPDFNVIAIATGRNDPAAIERFNETHGIVSLDTYLDPKGRLSADMNVPGLPVTAVLNRQGDEIARLMGGADWNSDSAKAILNALIAMKD